PAPEIYPLSLHDALPISHWQALQQNLPATPVTDIKVHHGDLVISTMGRSFWIMDDVAPLRQLAASVMKPARLRSTDAPNGEVRRDRKSTRLNSSHRTISY